MKKDNQINMIKAIFVITILRFMIPIKALLAGLVCVSLCMANISGVVTDTSGVTPIFGAVVQLEKGEQTATTDAKGHFTLTISTAILSGNSTLLPCGLSARISGNMLNVTIAERSAVEVGIFDLCGKSLFTVHKTLDAGSQGIALPQRGAGIYLYKVKSGSREFMLKGNAVGGISYENSANMQGTSVRSLAKQAKTAAKITDVITVTKTGLLNYHCVIGNSDTSGVEIKMIENAGNVTDIDGNVYQSVRIGNQVWMTENLRVTKYNDGSAIQLDTPTITWNADKNPKYCYYKNTTNRDSINKYGALYNWYAVNTGKLAPTGWHVPTDHEWAVLEKYLVLHGYNYDGTMDTNAVNKIAKAIAAKTDWPTYEGIGDIGDDLAKNNKSGFSALPGGYRNLNGSFSYQGNFGTWWSATESELSAYAAYYRYLHYIGSRLHSFSDGKGRGFSVRLVSD